MADNVQLNQATTAGATMRTLEDTNSVQWPACVVAYATTVGTPDVLQEVTPSAGLPVAQQGAWSVTAVQATAANLLCTASQGGSWTVAATQSGTWTVTANAGTGTFAVSAASLPLPAGAATAAKQPALGTAGTPSSDVITVQGITSMTALKVDGSAVTQPISGTVTANAGTGTFTVSGAVTQSGTWTVQPGNTANTTPWLFSVNAGGNTATVTASNALKVDGSAVTQPVSGTVTANQGGTWNVGTVTAVTGITNALPSGSNIIGIVSACAETNTVFNGVTPLTPKFAVITASASGNTQVIASVVSKKLRVLRYQVSANGAVNVKFQSNTTDITGLSYLTQYASAGGAFCPVGLFETAAGEALNINLSSAVAVGGVCTYLEV